MIIERPFDLSTFGKQLPDGRFENLKINGFTKERSTSSLNRRLIDLIPAVRGYHDNWYVTQSSAKASDASYKFGAIHVRQIEICKEEIWLLL